MSTLPGPRGRLRTTLGVLRDPLRWYADAVRQYGPLFSAQAANGDLVVVASADLARQVFALQADDTTAFAASMLKGVIGEGSVFTMGGTRHLRERRLLMPAFHGPRMHAFGGAIEAVVQRVIRRWAPGSTIVAVDELVDVTFEVIVRVVFGVEDEATVARFLEVTRRLIALAHPVLLFLPATQVRFFGLSPYDRLLAARAEADALLDAEIQRRRASGARGSDILSLLVDSTYEDGAPLRDDHLRDELVTLLFAGHETTSVAVAWALYELAGSPDDLARLTAELDAAPPGHAALPDLPFLSAVWDETLRLHPPLSDVLREVTRPVEIGGHRVEPGQNLVVATCWMHRDPAVFTDPDAFRPSRMIDQRPPPFQLTPFGGGLRRCVGAALATFEAQIVLAEIVRHVRFERVGEEVAVRRNATMGPKHGVRLRVSPR